MGETWTVGPAARLVGATVRALHHYEAVGLVRPSGRTPAGYRVYTEADLDRLRQVLVWRELGFGLDAVPALLEGGAADRLGRLRAQLDAVAQRIDRLQQVRAALEQEVTAMSGGPRLTQEEKRALFGDAWTEHEQEWAQESEQRWGETDAYRESQRRTAGYGPQEWSQAKADMTEVQDRFVALLRAGEPADGDRAMAVAEQAREVNARWFYAMSGEVQVGLGRMFVADERFAAQYEQVAPGLAEYVSAAYVANGERVQRQEGTIGS